MSLRGKEVRPQIEPELHEKLSIMAEHRGIPYIADLAAQLLEKAIVAEWHEVSVALRRSVRLGKRWKAVEGQGSGDLFDEAAK